MSSSQTRDPPATFGLQENSVRPTRLSQIFKYFNNKVFYFIRRCLKCQVSKSTSSFQSNVWLIRNILPRYPSKEIRWKTHSWCDSATASFCHCHTSSHYKAFGKLPTSSFDPKQFQFQNLI